MWVMTPIGFYSVVQHRDRPRDVLVRARVREDLVRLQALLLRDPRPIQTDMKADYPFRVTMPATTWRYLASALAEQIDYPNVKDAVKDRQGAVRAGVYTRVWSVLRDLEQLDPTIQAEHVAAAGVVWDEDGDDEWEPT